MSAQITDTSGAPLLYVNLHLSENSESVIVVARVPCAAGKFLAGPADESAQVLARRTGSGDSFVNLATSPIDLSAWAGSTISFDFKVHALAVSAGLHHVALRVRVTFNP